ncbi:MAG: TonB family protein [Acidimicrobiales bacterium]|nr:TonB family protein [Hyphomonadaceae bacterium]RZV41108.1 MAG: TonB family protein [Acidimicrobiales bacterium]
MGYIFTVLVSTALLTFSTSLTAFAKIPTEVLAPYKAYTAAKEKGDDKAIYDNAKKAWETAEKVMGDSKTTGDLANNFAELFALGTNPYKNYKLRRKARERSIELAIFYPEDEKSIVEIDRRLKLAEMSLSLRAFKGNNRTEVSAKNSDFDAVERALKKYDMLDSTFAGDLYVLKSRLYNLRKMYNKSIEYADRAERVYESATDDQFTHYPYVLPLYKGDSLKALNKPVQAALEYQTVMQNLKGKLPADHPFIASAFKSWMKLRSSLEDAGRLKEAEKAGLCECWPYEDYKSKVTPLKRTPPKMPGGFASGKKSGHVVVMFDVDNDGKPFNIRKVSSTSSKLDKAAMKSVKDWEFSKRSPDEADNARKDVSTTITFRLMDARGNILPE